MQILAEVNKAKLILKSVNRPDINEKDDMGKLVTKTYFLVLVFEVYFFLTLQGRTALHIACEYDNINAVEELLEANALANIRAKDGSTPLHVIIKLGLIILELFFNL